MSGIADNIWGDENCRKGIYDPKTKKWERVGKYYGKCGCNFSNCPKGYSDRFDSLYDEQHNPIDKAVVSSGYKGKTCGEIAGKFPDGPDWNKKTFDDCVKYHALHQGVNNELRKLQPVNKVFTQAVESFKDSPPKGNVLSFPYDPDNGAPQRIISFNKQLKDKIKKDHSFLDGQAESTSLLQRSNEAWKNMMAQMHETDREVTQQMQVKTRLAEINNEAARHKSNVIMVITGAFSAFFIGLLAWVGYLSGNISMRTMLGMFVAAVIVFLVFAVGLNKYAVRKFKKFSKKLKKEIIHEGDKLNLAALQWVDDNCNCPDDDNGNKNKDNDKASDAYNKMMEHQWYDDDSIYYDDGTKKHKITPATFAKETGYLPCDLQDTQKKYNELNSDLTGAKTRLGTIVDNLTK